MKLAACLLAASAAIAPSPAVAQGLDFNAYRTQVEPLFLKARSPLNGPCVVCHSKITSRLRLQSLPPGATSWTEEQSKQNFALAVALVTPGDPLKSRLLLHPLSAEAGGDPTHTGGKFWQSRNDPELITLAAWVS